MKLRNDSVIYGLSQLGERVVSFFLLPILTKSLSLSEYAVWSVSIVTVGIMTPIVQLGFQTAMVKYLPMLESCPEERDSLLSIMMLIIFLVVGCVATIFFGFSGRVSFFIFGSNKYIVYIPILFCLMVSEVFFDFITNVLRSLGFIRRISLYSFLKGLLRISIILFAIRAANIRFYPAFVLYVVAQLILVMIFYGVDIPVRVPLTTKLSVNKELWRKIIALSLPIVVFAVLVNLNNFSDRFFLSHFQPLKELSIYSAAYSLAGMSVLFYSVLGFTLFPVLSRRWATDSCKDSAIQIMNQAIVVFLFFLIPFIIGISCVGPNLLKLFATDEYVVSWYVMTMLGCNIGMFGIFQILCYVIFLENKSLYVMYTMIVVTSVNMLLNAILIPTYGMTGATIAGFVSNLLLVSIVMCFIRRKFTVSFPWMHVRRILFHSAAMGFFLLFMRVWPGYGNPYCLSVVILFSSMLYLILDLFDCHGSILIDGLKE